MENKINLVSEDNRREYKNSFQKITTTRLLRLVLYVVLSSIILKYATDKLDTYNMIKILILLTIVFIVLDIYIPHIDFA